MPGMAHGHRVIMRAQVALEPFGLLLVRAFIFDGPVGLVQLDQFNFLCAFFLVRTQRSRP